MHMIIARLANVSLSFGLTPLLDHADLAISRGERLCLLGRNGAGKSSLLKILGREILPDSGEVWIRPGARSASLAQEVASAEDADVRALVRQSARFDGADAQWQAELEAERIISRLGLDADAHLSSLSGGWRRRAMLGCALAARPDLQLLDEPTNHLDIDAIDWLEGMMLEFAGALLFVSHDRAFVRRLATRIVDLDRGHLTEWPGDYDDYVLRKRAALDVEARHDALFDRKLAEEEVWIRQGIEARRTRNAGRVRALKELRVERRARRERAGRIELKVQEATPSGKLVFDARNVGFDLDGKPLIDGFSARVMREDRIGIIGPNGCGKTTMIRILMGEIEPTRGSVERGTSLKAAYFDQQRAALNLDASIMDNVTGGSGDTITIDGRARHVSGYLRDFLFPPERLRAPVSMLSGGERNRLMLAKLFAQPSNLLVMDEPTNDLDAETLDLIEEKIADYSGTVLLVSHDRAFLDNIVTSTWVFGERGRIEEYVGGYTDSMRQRAEAAGARGNVRATPPPGASGRAPAEETAGEPVRAAPPRRRSYQERRELEALPVMIEKLESEQSALQAALADPGYFRERPDEARASTVRLRDIEIELEEAYARWSALESS
jgi:ABC transport system ATP-binding/permease protein